VRRAKSDDLAPNSSASPAKRTSPATNPTG
jgi:hypothetical protein